MEFLILMIMLTARTKVSAVQPKPSCQTRCGNISIPYPFGTEPGCFLEDKFFVKCNNTNSDAPTPYFGNTTYQVLDIYLDGQFRIDAPVASYCYAESNYSQSDIQLSSGRHHISHTRNKFRVVGCDTYSLVQGYNGQSYATGCLSLCNNITDVMNGSCSGIACCQADIPRGLEAFNLTIGTYFNGSSVSSFNPCSYAFIAEDGAYNFSVSDLGLFSSINKTVLPMVLDWRVGNQSCSEAKKDPENYACKENTICEDPDYDNGYLCRCSDGFQGNPYISNGCQDINECETLNPCNSTCHNTFGSFKCLCPKGYVGDGWRNGTGCSPKADQSNRLVVAEELKTATNNYHESRILGQGGQGTVYKGILPGNRTVAIKKSRIGDASQVETFVNEIIMLCQINHRNVVKLLGCCFETEVPSLVYEFVDNGTLLDHIHNVADADSFLIWETRLRIATETAEAISYLHSAASVPIIHRDIKLANILLDEHYTAKVSDFGASRFIPIDQAEINTIVQGTFGYLDPEYMHTSLLNEKSDVYSFGAVLTELLTGKKMICFQRSEENRCLPKYFVSSMKKGRLLEILDPRLLNDGNFEQIMAVSALAKQCVAIKGEDRPTMKEVAHQLAGLASKQNMAM
ncbi:hypothetical protein PTKIN_Ptkin18bG0142900 [Pterospermum kingtungense]